MTLKQYLYNYKKSKKQTTKKRWFNKAMLNLSEAEKNLFYKLASNFEK